MCVFLCVCLQTLPNKNVFLARLYIFQSFIDTTNGSNLINLM